MRVIEEGGHCDIGIDNRTIRDPVIALDPTSPAAVDQELQGKGAKGRWSHVLDESEYMEFDQATRMARD